MSMLYLSPLLSKQVSKSEASRFLEDISAGKIVIDASEILGKGGSRSDIHDYVKSLGYDFTKEEMLEVVNEKGLAGDDEISEEQMESLAGGSNTSVVTPGLWRGPITTTAEATGVC